MILGVTILGNNSALPAYGRHPTAQLLTTPEEMFLIDCGEGTQMRLAELKVKHGRISRILISHLHGDHFFGLIGLINTWNLLQRTHPLTVHGPAELEELINYQLNLSGTKLSYAISFQVNGPEEELVYEGKTVKVYAFPVQHRLPCWGYRFEGKTTRRKLDVEKALAAGVPKEFFKNLTLGEDYADASTGRVVSNSEVTLPPRQPASYAYSADTVFHLPNCRYFRGVDLLYHESTYLSADEDLAAARFHSTAAQAASIALQAGVKKLLLGHFSSRYEKLAPFAAEACAVFPETELSNEGVTYLLHPRIAGH